MTAILNLLFGRRLARETSRYLDEIASFPIRESREAAAKVINDLAASPEPKITLGRTEWNQEVAVPASEIINGHALITGGSGAGKTRFALGILKSLIEYSPKTISFGVLDAKGELFSGAVALLAERLEELNKTDPSAAEALRRRIVVVDFSSRNPVSPYNVLARQPSVDPSYFAESRADLLLDLLSGTDALSLGGTGVLRRAIMLLAECELPVTWLNRLFYDDLLRAELLNRSTDTELRSYFTRQYQSVPKQTIAALSRRMEALFASEAVRLSLSGATAPDFRALQDESQIVLINCFGANLSKGVRQLLMAIVLSDISQSVFARGQRNKSFLWCCDEAQLFFQTEKLRDHMSDLLTMARSFRSFFLYLTQNIGAAIHDVRLLNVLNTNIRWSFSMRGEPNDCAFLKPALPITGRRLQPQTNPFEEPHCYSLSDERAMELNTIAHLPDRTGFFWLRPRSREAIKITTQNVLLPQGTQLDGLIRPLLEDPGFGSRISRKLYDEQIAERNRNWRSKRPKSESNDGLAEAYRRLRGDNP